MKGLKVIKLTNNNIPEGECIAIGYQEECLVGYISGDVQSGFMCESDTEELEEVTHFIHLPIAGINYK